MALTDIPRPEYEIYSNPPLKAMLGQVRFPPVLKIADLATLASFQDRIRDGWPTFTQEQQFSFVLGPAAGNASGSEQVFRFTSEDGAWSIALSTDALSLEATSGGAYSSYDAFAERFRGVWEALLDVFGPTAVLRQGLRYVDHIEADRSATEWLQLINKDLLQPYAGPLASELEQAVSEARLRISDDILVFKHGIVRAGLENKNGYLLDFDYFSEERADVGVEALMERFDRYHEAVYALFRWCLTDEALEGFRGSD